MVLGVKEGSVDGHLAPGEESGGGDGEVKNLDLLLLMERRIERDERKEQPMRKRCCRSVVMA